MASIRTKSTRKTPKTSRFRGVSYDFALKQWRVTVQKDKKIVARTFRSTEEAAVQLVRLVKQALRDPSFVHEELQGLSYFRERFNEAGSVVSVPDAGGVHP